MMKFDNDTTIGEILEKAPEKADILLEIGMHCLACAVHGIDVQEVIEKLNA